MLGDLNDDFREIEIVGADLRLFMSTNQVRYAPGDVIAVYTVSGGESVTLQDDDFDLSRGIPPRSIVEDQLAFSFSDVINWQPCTLSTITSSNTVATLPGDLTLSAFVDIAVLWNTGTGTPINGANGNLNRDVVSIGPLAPLRDGLIAAGRSVIIDSIGRGADQFAIQIASATETATTLQVSLININNPDIGENFIITNVWVR